MGYALRLVDGGSVHREVIQQIRNVKNVHGVVITPGWDDAGRTQRVILGITAYYHGMFFAADAIYDGANHLLLGPPNARQEFFITMPNTTSEAVARKLRSEAILRTEGVPFIDHLPIIEDEATAAIRSKTEITKRAVALALVASRGEGLDLEGFKQLVSRFDAEDWFTPNERAAVFKETLTERERIDSTWRYEACAVLLWALGYIKMLPRPDQLCEPAQVVGLIAGQSFQAFMNGVQLRTASELLDQADIIYWYHWAVQEARLRNQNPSSGLESGVVYERHYALNWLIGYADLPWDDVSTDT